MKNRGKKLKELKAKMKNIEEVEYPSELQEMEKAVEEIALALKSKEENAESIKNQLNDIGDLKIKAAQEVFEMESSLKRYTTSLEDLGHELKMLEKESSKFFDKKDDESKALKNLEESLRVLGEQERETALKISSSEQEIKDSEEKRKKEEKALVQYRSERESLSKEVRHLKSAREFVVKEDDRRYYLMEKIIKFPEQYRKGIERLMGDILKSVITKDGLKKWPTKEEIHFISLGKSSVSLKKYPSFIPLIDIIQIEKDYQEQTAPLLSGLYLVDDLKIDVHMNFKAVSTFDGTKMIKKEDGLIIYSSFRIQENSSLEEVTEKIIETEADIGKLASSIKDQKQGPLIFQRKI